VAPLCSMFSVYAVVSKHVRYISYAMAHDRLTHLYPVDTLTTRPMFYRQTGDTIFFNSFCHPHPPKTSHHTIPYYKNIKCLRALTWLAFSLKFTRYLYNIHTCIPENLHGRRGAHFRTQCLDFVYHHLIVFIIN